MGKQRITIDEIKNHPWFLKSLPKEIAEGYDAARNQDDVSAPLQSVESIMRIVDEARNPGENDGSVFEDGLFYGDELDFDPDVGSSGDFVCAV